MHHDLILTFCDPITKENEYDIPFALANNTTSIKWLKILYEDIYINKCTWNNDRFVGFGTDILNNISMSDEMNKLIDICEKERPGYFNMKTHENMSQEDFNNLHLLIEKYRGDFTEPHDFFTNGTEEFKYCIEKINQLIHAWEKYNANISDSSWCNIVIDIKDGKREYLHIEDFLNFKFDRTYNTIYLSYIMRGKGIVDMWIDNDYHVGGHNIKPHVFLASNFTIRTRGWTDQELSLNTKQFNQWFDRNSNYLNSLGFYRDDPKCTIGWLPLAHCLLPEIKSIIEPRQFLKNIKIFEA